MAIRNVPAGSIMQNVYMTHSLVFTLIKNIRSKYTRSFCYLQIRRFIIIFDTNNLNSKYFSSTHKSKKLLVNGGRTIKGWHRRYRYFCNNNYLCGCMLQFLQREKGEVYERAGEQSDFN